MSASLTAVPIEPPRRPSAPLKGWRRPPSTTTAVPIKPSHRPSAPLKGRRRPPSTTQHRVGKLQNPSTATDSSWRNRLFYTSTPRRKESSTRLLCSSASGPGVKPSLLGFTSDDSVAGSHDAADVAGRTTLIWSAMDNQDILEKVQKFKNVDGRQQAMVRRQAQLMASVLDDDGGAIRMRSHTRPAGEGEGEAGRPAGSFQLRADRRRTTARQ